MTSAEVVHALEISPGCTSVIDALRQSCQKQLGTPGKILNVAGVKYAYVTDPAGEPTLLHISDGALSFTMPEALVGERIMEIHSLVDMPLVEGARAYYPGQFPRWQTITPGTRIVYCGIGDRSPIAIDEILEITPHWKGSHLRTVTYLRIDPYRGTSQICCTEKTESSLSVPPSDIPEAFTVQIYTNTQIENDSFLSILEMEQQEQLRSATLIAKESSLIENTHLFVADGNDSLRLSFLTTTSKCNRYFSRSANDQYFSEASSVGEELALTVRSLQDWCRAIETSLHQSAPAIVFHVTNKIQEIGASSQRSATTAYNGIQELKEILTFTPSLSPSESICKIALIRRLDALLSQVHKVPSQTSIKTFTINSVSDEILERCSAIASARVILPPTLQTNLDYANALSSAGGFMYSEYSVGYLRNALRDGAMLIALYKGEAADQEIVVFALVHDAANLPPHLCQILPGLREKNYGYFEVIAADKKESTALENSQIFQSAIARVALRGASGIAGITNVYNGKIQNMLLKAGFLPEPESAVKLRNPTGGQDGKYCIYSRSFREHDGSSEVPLLPTSLQQLEGYLTSTSDEFAQMSALAIELGDAPITWFSFGVASLEGEALEKLKGFLAFSQLDEMEGIATYIPTRTVDSLETSEHAENKEWRLVGDSGAGILDDLFKRRSEKLVTVGLALVDPKLKLASTPISILTPDGGSKYALTMQGNEMRRTIFDYENCSHALKFRVAFPDVPERESIWGLGNYRAAEFLSLFNNRMCIFAGGGTTIPRGIRRVVEAALEQRQGKTTVVLLQGAGGTTDQVVQELKSFIPEAFQSENKDHLEVKVIDITDGAQEMVTLLHGTGRLPL